MTEETQYALGRMEAKLDQLLQYREEHLSTHEKLEGRITKLESWRWMLIGAAGVFSVIFEAIKALVLKG